MLTLLLTIVASAYVHADNETTNSSVEQNWTNLSSDEELSSARFKSLKEHHREVHGTVNIVPCSESFYQSLEKILELACDHKVGELTTMEAGHFFDDEIKRCQSVFKRRRLSQIILDMLWFDSLQQISDIFPSRFEIDDDDVDRSDIIAEE